MTDKVQKIREKVVEIINSTNPFIPDEDGKNSDYEAGKLDAATRILQIMDSLEEPVSEDLENAAKRYTTEGDEISGLCVIDEEVVAFKAGAKWQKEKDFQYLKKECEKTGSFCDNDIAIEAAKRHPYYYASEMEGCANIGFKEGAMWQKEQMMTNAIEVTVYIDAGGYPYIPQIELYDYDKDEPLAKDGDKYKVVLIKEKLI